MAILVIGAKCSLGEAVVDKLLSLDIDVIAEESSHYFRNQSVLKYTNSKLLDQGTGFSISFDGSEADIVVGRDIILHDIIPTRVDKWLAPEIRQWIVGKNHKTSNSRFWLSVTDAANAISHLIKAGIKPKSIHMCGRREWLPEDSKAEFDMLWERTNQGQSGEFTAETLFGHQIAGMEPKPISYAGKQRPDLSPLHEILLDLTGDGWRPMVQLRTMFMTLIADVVNNVAEE